MPRVLVYSKDVATRQVISALSQWRKQKVYFVAGYGAFVKIQYVRLLILLAVVPGLTTPALGQSTGAREALGNIVGTVMDMNNGAIPGAAVVIQGPVPDDRRTVLANHNGYFELDGVKPNIPYHLVITADGFAEWTSPVVTLQPGQYKILTDCILRIEAVHTTVDVAYISEEIAEQQLKAEVQQRVFGIIPNFYVVYEPNPEPLTPKMKFKLAFRVAVDPVTAVGVGAYSGIQQWADTPDYPQGAKGFGERLGANAAGGFANIMIGGAILPSLLHQDPRYFYQGKGTNKSRILHALSHPFVCNGDNGRLQPNYSSIGGDLASSALATAYYPDSNRGAGMVLGNFAINTAARLVSSLAQEFILGKFTHKAAH